MRIVHVARNIAQGQNNYEIKGIGRNLQIKIDKGMNQQGGNGHDVAEGNAMVKGGIATPQTVQGIVETDDHHQT